MNRTFLPLPIRPISLRCNDNFDSRQSQLQAQLEVGGIKTRHEVHDENKYEVTEDLYKDRRRIVPDATLSCSVSGHPYDKRGQGE